MGTEHPDYTLYYWPVPFRGHFIRAILAWAGADWKEGDFGAGGALVSAEPADQPVPFMGLPVLVDHTSGFAVSQMVAIAGYLGEKFALMPESAEGRALCLKVAGDANDIIDEITLQGGMMMWTAQTWQAFLPELRRWMRIGEDLGRRCGLSREGGFLLGTSEATIADIITATLWMTLRERFAAIGELLDEEASCVAALSWRMWETPALARFGRETLDQFGDAYCGGQIGKSLRAVAC